MNVGVDYAAELWPEERWLEDARLMKEAGVTVARIGQFAWSHIEPDENYYSTRWLTRVMDIFVQHGIKAIVAIPTGSPPPWLVHKFPEILPMNADGKRLQPGTFNHRCFLNKHYHDYARNFAMRLTKELWSHRAILGWQIDGRPAATRCYCETCHHAFLEWLKKKYTDVEHLNRHWGTAAWGQEYDDFVQIPLPWRTTGAANDPRAHSPSLVLDFWRFSSESAIEFLREQAVIVQRYTTKQLNTITWDRTSWSLNFFDEARGVEFMSSSHFPFPAERDASHPQGDSFGHDLVRGLKQKNFWVTEHQVGATGWNELGPSLPPGQARAFAWQSVAHGADSILFSPWRSNPSGAAQLAEGVLGPDGVPRRRYREVKQFAGEVARIGKSIDGTRPKNDVAILWDSEQVWALEIQGQTAGKRIDYTAMARRFHDALRSLGIGCDIVDWRQDFAHYKILLLPPQYLLETDRAKKLLDYITKGGTAVVSTRSGIKNYHNVNHSEPVPASLRLLLGIEVVESDVLCDQRTNRVRLATGGEFEAAAWCDVLELKGAEVIGQYTREFYKNSPAITMHAQGKGKAYYVAAVMGTDFHRAFLSRLAAETGVQCYNELPGEVEILSRRKEGKELLFVINHSAEVRKATICRKGKNLFDGSAVDSIVTLEPYGVAAIEI